MLNEIETIEARIRYEIRSLTLHLRYEIATDRFRKVLYRLREAAAEQKYRADQPCAPKGTPIGGQWIVDPSSARQQALRNDRVLVAQARDEAFYHIDIRLEDAKGGHGWHKHVERSKTQLRAVMDAERLVVRLPNGGSELHFHEAEGSFWSTGDANFYISETLRANPELVELAVQGTMSKTPIGVRKQFDTPVGYEAYRASYDAPVLFRDAYWVEVWIVYDPNNPKRSYRVDSAYPMNSLANEEPIL